MGKTLSRVIAAFARTGNPDVPGQPHWPPFNPQTRETMLFDRPLKVVKDPDADKRSLWTPSK
jgi:para-nitrobenzyl esterase